ncbi:transposase [Cytobacillus spongiae]|jgi:transposase|uniref:transposase n=1 Tax=Cytobacillus spongiae TaxID=2901381 RepID=UPI001F33E500|nr:transposase [Cytobacillus spongiae]UII55913.1 transposase [Cytobacillus spongiae]
MKQKRYNQEFKQTIVELYRSGTSVSNLNREYGVSEVTIYNWVKALSPIENSGGLTPVEVAEIQKENLRLQQEVEIQKRL